MKRWLPALLMLLAAGAASAQPYSDASGYRVYHAAINSEQLTAEIARTYGIARARDSALLSFSVQRKDGERYVPVSASGKARVRSLIGHQREVALHVVRENELQTLAGSVTFDDGEVLVIEAEILPSGADQPIRVSFRQQFYKD